MGRSVEEKKGTPKMRSGRGISQAGAVLLAAALTVSAAGRAPAQQVLTLHDAMSIAMENSPNIRHTRLNLESSEASLRAQEAGLKTQFRFQLGDFSYRNTNQFDEFFSRWYRYESYDAAGRLFIEQPIKWTGGTLSLNDRLSYKDAYSEINGQSEKTYRNELYLQFDQPLFTYNRTKMQLRSLELDFESNQLTYAVQLLELEQTVMSSFYDLYELKMSLEINHDALENDRAAYKIMKNKYDAGIGKLDDLTQAETDMLSSESNYNSTSVSLANANDRFKYLIGLPIEDSIDIKADIDFQPVGIDMEFAVEHGLANRMELRENEIQIANALDAVIRAGATNEFSGNLSLSWGSSGTNTTFSDLYDKRVDEQYVTLGFDIPIWDWGQKKNTIKASELSLESSRLNLEEQKYQIKMEIREACRRLDNLVLEIELARRRVKSAEKTYEINLEKYQNGDLTSQLLGDYRQTLSSARLSEVRSLINYRLALLDLKIKSLWDFENDQAVVTVSTAREEEE
jgi:outer membrane protein TolC